MMFSTAIFIVVNLVFLRGLLGQDLPSADEILQQASEAANIPGINASALPIDEVKNVFKKKCEANGDAQAYMNFENAANDLKNCVKDLVNVTVLQNEVEVAKPTGDVDTVFRKYCNKGPILKACVRNFTTTLENCFEQRERENIRLIQNITESLLSFICFKEGDRIALFISAGGMECFQSKQTAIQDCTNSTFAGYAPAEGFNASVASGIDNIPLLLFNTKECADIEKLQMCIVRELETCSDPTPGNIADSLFNFVKKVTPCENLLSKARADQSVGRVGGSSTINGVHLITVAFSYLTLRFV